jgi:hypothetical protein
MNSALSNAARFMASGRKNPGRKPKLRVCPHCGATVSAWGAQRACYLRVDRITMTNPATGKPIPNPLHIYRNAKHIM